MQPAFTTRPDIRGTFGAVATTNWLATQTGMAVLEKGGNAFDAAAAAGFVLQIVEPHLNGPGGELPAIVMRAGADAPEVICGQGPFPAAASAERLRGIGLAQMPGTGLLPAVVPGAFDGWMLLLRDYGTLKLRDVLSYAIGYAEHGFPLVPRIVATIIPAVEYFQKEWPSSGEVWLVNGRPPHPDKPFRTPVIAETYRRILDEAEAAGSDRVEQIEAARHAFYTGFVAEAVDRFYKSELIDSTGKRHRGLLNGDDLAHYQARVEKPASVDYHGLTVHKLGPWSQGPVFLQQLRLLEGYDLAKLGHNTASYIHTVTEAAKLAFADREKFYGDPNFVEVPFVTLLSDAYNAERRKLIGEQASLELRPGAVEGFGALVKLKEGAKLVAGMGAGEPTVGRMGEVVGDTVHFDIVDQAGNMISSTPSGGWLQSSPVIPELGFGLGTRGQMFWLEEGHPASLAPGKRPRTTLSPTLALRDGDAYLAWGSPGGDQQDQWIAQFFLRHVHAGMNLQEAIDAQAWHSEHFPISFWPRTARPGVLVLENRVPKATVDELARRGHLVEVGPAWSEGRLTAASRNGSRRRAAANPRGMQGYAAGR